MQSYHNLWRLLRNNKGLILSDGAMGTELDRLDLPMSGSVNLTNPNAVENVHRAYTDSGSLLVTTNTLTMNRIAIETQKLGINVREVNLTGARLAKNAVSPGRFVLGDISSTGQMLEPLGSYTDSQFFDVFHEQAEALAEGGVDGFIIETMMDLREALCALKACKAISDIPVLVTMAFSTTARGGRTIMGNSAAEVARVLTDEGVTAVGANCGDLTPEEMAEIIAAMRPHTDLPLIAQPNAGRPRLVHEKAMFDLAPEAFAEGLRRCIEAGAQIIGGCCGTTPEHILAAGKLM